MPAGRHGPGPLCELLYCTGLIPLEARIRKDRTRTEAFLPVPRMVRRSYLRSGIVPAIRSIAASRS